MSRLLADLCPNVTQPRPAFDTLFLFHLFYIPQLRLFWVSRFKILVGNCILNSYWGITGDHWIKCSVFGKCANDCKKLEGWIEKEPIRSIITSQRTKIIQHTYFAEQASSIFKCWFISIPNCHQLGTCANLFWNSWKCSQWVTANNSVLYLMLIMLMHVHDKSNCWCAPTYTCSHWVLFFAIKNKIVSVCEWIECQSANVQNKTAYISVNCFFQSWNVSHGVCFDACCSLPLSFSFFLSLPPYLSVMELISSLIY